MSDNEPAEYDLPGQREYRSEGYDIGSIVKSPFRDDEWWKKALIMGLLGIIPIVGQLNLFGYLKATYETYEADAIDLPPANLGYIGNGFTLFVAFLPLGLLLVIAQGILAALNDGGFLGSLLGLVGAALALGFSFLTPAILYVAVRDNDMLASLRFERLKDVVMTGNVVTYLLLVVTILGLSVFADAGALVFCVGALFTTPLAVAMAGAALAEFDHERR